MFKKWVDCTEGRGDDHAGTKADPFSFGDANTYSDANPNDTGTDPGYFFCKGTYYSSGAVLLKIRGNKWLGWTDEDDIEVSETNSEILNFSDIWRVYAGTRIDIKAESSDEINANIISNCFLQSGIIELGNIGKTANCIFKPKDVSSVMYINQSSEHYGDSFYINISDPEWGGTRPIIENCLVNDVIPMTEPGEAAFDNDACQGVNIEDYYSTANCQFGWTMPTAPDIYSGDLIDFSSSVLCAGVTAPPQKGVDYPFYYTACDGYRYNYGLFGTERKGIGAVYFPVLEVDFAGDPLTGVCPLDVEFEDLTDWDITSITDWEWDFGDGGKSTSQNPSHTYQYPGTYTVSLKCTVGNYNGALISGDDPEPITNTETKVGYIVVTAAEDMLLEDKCLRFATEENEGAGWSEYDGDSFVSPVLGGAYLIQDDNQVERCIIEDEDGEIYEQSTFDRIVNLKPPFVDKADLDGSGGTEISGQRLERENCAGEGNQNKVILDEVNHIQIRPADADNRGMVGYDTSGMRVAQSFGLDVYVDGEKVQPSATIKDVPDNGDLVFPGVRVESRRIQYAVTFEASDFRLTESKHRILIKDAPGSTLEKTMVEYNSQLWYETDKVLHITRDNLLYDKVSKRYATGNFSKVVGPDGYLESALQGNEEIFFPDLNWTSSSYLFLFMASQGVGASIPWFRINGNQVSNMSTYSPVTIPDWTIYKLEFSGPINTLSIMTSIYPFWMYDLRIFERAGIPWESATPVAVTSYYKDIAINKGNAFLPAFISL
jgi:PKD repeat protein